MIYAQMDLYQLYFPYFFPQIEYIYIFALLDLRYNTKFGMKSSFS